MADQRAIKRSIKRLEQVKTWQLVVLLLLACFLTATFLRLNNVGMVERRAAVLSADKEGDDQGTANRLYELQVYATQHMNASSGDVYLSNKYNRDSKEIVNRTMGSQTPETPITVQAYNICKKSFSTWSQAAVQCVSDEVAKLTPKGDDGTVHVNFPNPDLYRFNYLSPAWTPDFAGFSLLVTAVLALVVILRILTWLLLKILVKFRYRRG